MTIADSPENYFEFARVKSTKK